MLQSFLPTAHVNPARGLGELTLWGAGDKPVTVAAVTGAATVTTT